jgi:hypothetical protein
MIATLLTYDRNLPDCPAFDRLLDRKSPFSALRRSFSRTDRKKKCRAAIPVLNKNTCGKRLNFLIFRNNFISLST